MYAAQILGPDPKAPLLRCLVVVPQVSGVATQVALLPPGTSVVPAAGTQVWVDYIGDNKSQPAVVSLFNDSQIALETLMGVY